MVILTRFDPSDPLFEDAVAYARSLFPTLRADLLDDLSQEVRLALWKSGRPEFRLTVAYRAAMDFWRHFWGRGERRRMGQLEIPVAQIADRAVPIGTGRRSDADEGAQIGDLDQVLVDVLGVRDAAMLVLYVEGHPMHAIAARYGVDESRVSQILRRARRRLMPVFGIRSAPQRRLGAAGRSRRK